MKKLANVGTALSKVTGRTGLVCKKHSPEILVVVGIAGIVGSAILACKATLKVEEVLDEHKVKIDKIEYAHDNIGEVEYDEKDYKRDLTVTYVQTGVDFAKLYGPAIILGMASIGCIIGGHGILKKRYVAGMAAYQAMEEGFKAYRKRVVDELGEEKDYMFKHGLTSETVTDVEIDEDGKPKKVKKEKLVEDPNGLSVYAKFFDESCTQWSKTPEYNLMFLKTQQDYHNQMLQARGHVFLNEVYDALGIPRTQAGSQVGWVLGHGDDFIDFGFSHNRDFINGYERSVLLDFNVDGIIWNLI